MHKSGQTTGKVISVNANLLQVEAYGPIIQNEICFIHLSDLRLMGEVIKISTPIVFVQVFEDTCGLKVGNLVEFTGNMLEITLGPGLLSQNFDGLQNDLNKMEGVFIKRGDYNYAIDSEKLWEFSPLISEGAVVEAGDWLGEVLENQIAHKIMVPFSFPGTYKIKTIANAGSYSIKTQIAILLDEFQNTHTVKMTQNWPAKTPLKAYAKKVRPFKLLETGIRVIDSLNPILEGGTGFIPGPFGSGKTVLQHLLSKHANVDIVVIAACGERANEVVEVFTEFPELDDPRTGKKLIERTVIIANTSNMPVAAREASVYTAMTIAEYYRSMGLKILLLADSTSRWAQALREMSNRMEELPGPDAFPMDLPATIANYYSRAGFTWLNNKHSGSVTFIGTVSPSGGNMKEPVTEATKKVARCFYALSQDRSDSKRYPAIEPIDSYSKYLNYPEFIKYADKNIDKNWLKNVNYCRNMIQRGIEAAEQINILGDDGVPVSYHISFWKSELIDFILLQQDAFDTVDCSSSIERQNYMLKLIISIIQIEFILENFDKVSLFFKHIINLCKQLNYSEFKSHTFKKIEDELLFFIDTRKA